jgi:hypothetical protein
MGFNKISGGANVPPMMNVGMPAGSYWMVPAGQGVVGAFGGVLLPQIGTNNPLSGQFLLQLGQYTNLQQYDQGTNNWQCVQVSIYAQTTISSDGTNYRVVNSTGCPVGAVITNAGSGGTNGFYGYAQGPGDSTQPATALGAAITIQSGIVATGNAIFTITPSAGGGLWNAIVGGAINSTISFSGTVFNGNFASANSGAGQSLGGFGQGSAAGGITASGGTLWTKPPILVFSPPANQGQQPYILPTAVCTISGGIINAITVIDQGAGLMGLPGIVAVPQPGDVTGGGAVLGWLFGATGTAGLGAGTGSGSVLAMWPAYYGTALTAVPTFTYGGTSNPAPTATAIMNWTVTSITNTTPGVTYTGAYAVWQGGVTVATPAANTSVSFTQRISNPIFPPLVVAATTGVTTLSGNNFGGVNIQAAATIALGTQLAAGTVGTVAVQTPVFGGASDVVKFISF